MVPPSPRLSARITSTTYLSDTTITSDQKMVDRPPKMLAGVSGMPCAGEKVSLTAYSGLVPMSPNTTPSAARVSAVCGGPARSDLSPRVRTLPARRGKGKFELELERLAGGACASAALALRVRSHEPVSDGQARSPPRPRRSTASAVPGAHAACAGSLSRTSSTAMPARTHIGSGGLGFGAPVGLRFALLRGCQALLQHGERLRVGARALQTPPSPRPRPLRRAPRGRAASLPRARRAPAPPASPRLRPPPLRAPCASAPPRR